MRILVQREGTEGLSMADYAAELETRLPDHEVELAETPKQEAELVEEATVVTGNAIDADALERANELRLFACTFAGTDHLPLDALSAGGVAVTNASGIHAPGIAEGVIGAMLTFARELHTGWRRQDRHEWRHYRPGELKGSTVTVVGLGAIGTAVTERLEGFDVDTIGVRYTPSKGGPTDEVVGFDPAEIHEAFARTDVLVLACPLTDTTRNLLDEATLATLPPSAVVINVSRGGVVDTDALVSALQTDGISGAALDVTEPEPLPPEHPLWRLENCFITPHVGGHTPKHWSRLAEILESNVRVLEADGPMAELTNLVRSPSGGDE